jgi:hypothetical protein
MGLRLLLALPVLAACSVGALGGPIDGAGPDAGPGFPPGPQPPPTRFAPDDLLADDMVFGGEAISASQVGDFLAERGSFLASYDDGGRSAATIIVEQGRRHGVSPLYLLARIQTESSLVTSGTDAHLAAATGCGCPDGGGCDPALSGFASQVDCAALKMKEYVAELDADGVTRAGWRVGSARDTGDPCTVTPANRATAALYTYTPWVGAYAEGCGRSDIGGSSLVALSYYRFWSAYPWGSDP